MATGTATFQTGQRTYAGPPLITMDVPAIEMRLAEQNLENDLAAVIQRTVDWVMAAGVDILDFSLPMVPWDTGKLRESGTVTMRTNLGNTDVATGQRKSKNVNVLPAAEKFTPQLSKRMLRRIKLIQAVIHFHRTADSNEGPRDIALWTHENLNPASSGKSPRARKPGTGPKYLENAFRARAPFWNSKFKSIELQIAKDQRDMAYIKTVNLRGNVFQRLTMKLSRLKKFVFFKRRR